MSYPLRLSTASQEVTLGYFVDSTDGNTEETALTIANTDIKLHKNGATTLANKNSGGGTHISNGIYYIVLDATDTNTIGPLTIYCHVSGALAVKKECIVYPAEVFDYQFAAAGTDYMKVDIAQVNGAAVSTTTAQLGVNAVQAGGTAWGSGAITAGSIASGAFSIAKFNSDVGTTAYASNPIARAVLERLTSALTVASTFGKLIVDNLNATVSSRSSHSAADVWAAGTRTLTAGTNIALAKGTGVTGFNDLDAAGVRTAVGLASANLDTQLATLATTSIKKNTALSNFEFMMYDSTDHITPKTGLTVTAERSIDGAAFGACANSVTEVANGVYKINLAAADLNGSVVTLKFTATGADQTTITIIPEA